jgi:hypothetical protein
MFGKKNKHKVINYLELTPKANYEHEIKPDGLVNVLVPKFTDFFFGRLLQPRISKKYIRANLDEFGSATWLEIDGVSSVGKISEKLLNKFGEKIQPVHHRVTKFMTELFRAGFIKFIELERKK